MASMPVHLNVNGAFQSLRYNQWSVFGNFNTFSYGKFCACIVLLLEIFNAYRAKPHLGHLASHGFAVGSHLRALVIGSFLMCTQRFESLAKKKIYLPSKPLHIKAGIPQFKQDFCRSIIDRHCLVVSFIQ